MHVPGVPRPKRLADPRLHAPQDDLDVSPPQRAGLLLAQALGRQLTHQRMQVVPPVPDLGDQGRVHQLGQRPDLQPGHPPGDLQVVAERAAAGDVCAIGLRFTEDPVVHEDRFAALEELLGDAFVGVAIDSSEGNPHGFGKQAHSVLTEEYKDEPGFPTHDAQQLVIEHFKARI